MTLDPHIELITLLQRHGVRAWVVVSVPAGMPPQLRWHTVSGSPMSISLPTHLDHWPACLDLLDVTLQMTRRT